MVNNKFLIGMKMKIRLGVSLLIEWYGYENKIRNFVVDSLHAVAGYGTE